jgi:hypothetical protein
MQDQEAAPLGVTGALVRLYWFFFGNAILFFLLLFIVEKHPKVPSLYDPACWLTIASLILVRYADVRFLNVKTSEGKPATLNDWRRYALLVGALGIGGWLLARVLAHLLK